MHVLKSDSKPDLVMITLPNTWQYGGLPHYYLALCAFADAHTDLDFQILDFAPRHHEFFKNEGLKFYKKEFVKEKYFEALVAELKRIKPKTIGISIFTVDYYFAMEMSEYIREAGIREPIIMGNVHTSLFPGDCIYPGSPVDYAVIGEGETTLTELVKALVTDSDMKKIPGIMYLAGDRPTRTGSRSGLDISHLPAVPYDRVDMNFYLKPRRALIRNMMFSGVDVFTGRGCPYFCSFCAANNLYDAQGVKKGIRYQTLDAVFKNIDTLVNKHHVDAVYVLDDTFTISKPRVMEFCERIKPYKIKWGAETRVNLVTAPILKAMADAGCLQLDFGVETGAPDLLKDISKGITIDSIKSCFKLCKEHNIRPFANMMVNMPGETEDHIRQTEELLLDIKPTVLNVSIMKPYPATPIFTQYIKTEHFEYIRNLDDFVNDDFSMFKLAAHNLDLVRLRDRLATMDGKSAKERRKEILVALELLLKSKRRWQYVTKRLYGYMIETIFAAREFKNSVLRAFGKGAKSEPQLLGTNDAKAYGSTPWARSITTSAGVRDKTTRKVKSAHSFAGLNLKNPHPSIAQVLAGDAMRPGEGASQTL